MSDAAALSSIQQNAVSAEVSTRVARKALDVAEQQGDAAISLLEQAAELAKQLSFEPNKGSQIDVTA